MTDRIKKRIANLLRLADNNPSAHEAAQAFATAQEMATRHALELDECVEDDEQAPPAREVEGIARRTIERWNKAVPWKITIAHAVARANGCKTYYTSGHGGHITAYGQPSDLETVHTTYLAILAQVEGMAKRAIKAYKADPDLDPRFDESPRSYGRSWRMGCAAEVRRLMPARETYVEQERKRIAEASPGSTALVRVDAAAEYTTAVAEAVEDYAKTELKLKSGRGFARPSSSAGYRDGRRAGANVSTSTKGALS